MGSLSLAGRDSCPPTFNLDFLPHPFHPDRLVCLTLCSPPIPRLQLGEFAYLPPLHMLQPYGDLAGKGVVTRSARGQTTMSMSLWLDESEKRARMHNP